MKKLAGRLVVALTVTAAAAAPVACGSDSAGEPAAKPATVSGKPAATTARVVIRSFAFAPTTAAVKAGTKLTFANEDNASHTATSTTGLSTPTESTRASARRSRCASPEPTPTTAPSIPT